jgi:hypothetical protein
MAHKTLRGIRRMLFFTDGLVAKKKSRIVPIGLNKNFCNPAIGTKKIALFLLILHGPKCKLF